MQIWTILEQNKVFKHSIKNFETIEHFIQITQL